MTVMKPVRRMIVVRKRRVPRRRNMLRRRRPLQQAQKIHFHKKTVYVRNAITITNSAGISVNKTYQLSDLPTAEVTYLSNLYQLYCLKGVRVELIPQANVNELGQSGAPNVHSAIDYTENVGKTTAQLAEYASYKMTRGQRTHKRYFRPRAQQPVYSGITPAYTSLKQNLWLSTQTTNSLSCPHYGLDITIDPIQTGGELTMYYDQKVTYYLAFKSTK